MSNFYNAVREAKTPLKQSTKSLLKPGHSLIGGGRGGSAIRGSKSTNKTHYNQRNVEATRDEILNQREYSGLSYSIRDKRASNGVAQKKKSKKATSGLKKAEVNA